MQNSNRSNLLQNFLFAVCMQHLMRAITMLNDIIAPSVGGFRQHDVVTIHHHFCCPRFNVRRTQVTRVETNEEGEMKIVQTEADQVAAQ